MKANPFAKPGMKPAAKKAAPKGKFKACAACKMPGKCGAMGACLAKK